MLLRDGVILVTVAVPEVSMNSIVRSLTEASQGCLQLAIASST
jgi:hypothetical protein